MHTAEQQLETVEEQAGFTLIELMVVVLIIGILMAIAIPTYLSLTSRATTNSAEANITTALEAAATAYAQNSTYGATPANVILALNSVNTGINFVVGPPASSGSVGVTRISGSEIILSSEGQAGTYYWADDSNGTTTYATGTNAAAPTSSPGWTGSSWAAPTAYN